MFVRKKPTVGTHENTYKDTVHVLSGPQISEELDKRNIIIEPRPKKIEEISVDLRLDNYFGEFTITEKPYIDLANEPTELQFVEKEFFCDKYLLHPGRFVLAQTFEYIVIPNNIFAKVDGRSSLGRRGLLVHATASYVDPGWKGRVVLELANLGEMPIELFPLMRIARLVFYKLNDPVKKGYDGQYSGQIKIIPPPPDEEIKKIKSFTAKRLKDPEKHNKLL